MGAFAYVVALFERYSLGVASLAAQRRFHVGAATLSALVLLQLLVYAALQIPVGVLLDRFGPRRLIVTGLLLMTVGQTVFALASVVSVAVAARVLLGCGDALIFISVVRLVAAWFPPARNPVMVQVTGVVGQLGAILAAIPLLSSLQALTWTPTFLLAAALAGGTAAIALVVLNNAPAGTTPKAAAEVGADTRQALRTAWSHPGTRLGLWTHFVAFFPGLTFSVLWGYPFLVRGEQLSPSAAGILLTTLTASSMAIGPALGNVVARHPLHRSSIVLAAVAATAAMWLVVLAWPAGPAPLPILVLLVVIMGSSGPTALVGFDFARSFNARDRMGAASGIVNVGGFVATLLAVVAIGAAVDLVPHFAGSESSATYRWAFTALTPLWLVGAGQVIRYRRLLRRSLASGSVATVS